MSSSAYEALTELFFFFRSMCFAQVGVLLGALSSSVFALGLFAVYSQLAEMFRSDFNL